MSFFEWDNRFNIGVYEIDNQHKNLAYLVNTFFESIRKNNNIEEIKLIVNELSEYIWVHFQTEENLMRDIDYQEYATHQCEHKRFAKYIENTQEKIIKGNVPDLIELENFMRDLLVNHVLTFDQHYGLVLKEKNVRLVKTRPQLPKI
ncbi:MAG: hemerythrin family protein [Gammaproteobacteria bacterium]|nr:hemerythrin family protein [Gammaproteobacteria bacterium]MCP5197709.1 hemerythrin family protein [Gammaproteobacteria bacterium]